MRTVFALFSLLGLTSTLSFNKFITRSPRLIHSTSLLSMSTKTGDVPKDIEGWRTKLSPDQFKVLRESATEPPGYSENKPGELEFELKQEFGTKCPKEDIIYSCVGCSAPLYTAGSKFDSGCGWPAFYEGIEGAIKEIPDPDGRRVEIVCSNCESHLGHVFKGEGFPTPTDERHCVNGICLKYEPAN